MFLEVALCIVAAVIPDEPGKTNLWHMCLGHMGEHGDIGIPDGPAEDSTRDLLKAHNPKLDKPGSPLKHRLW